MKERQERERLRRGREVDMLHGPLAGKLFRFALPIAASSILQQLFNSADIAVVGRFAAEGALAAVGSNAVIVALFVGLLTGLSIGTNVMISQYVGQRRNEDIGRVVHTSMLFSVLCGTAVMAVGIPLARPVLTWMGTPADVLDRAVLYLRIYFVGMPFIIPYNFGAAILRSVGDTKRPMLCLVASGVLNVALNLLLVIVFRLDVAGVAIATAISNLFSAAAVFVILCRETGAIRLQWRRMRISGPVLGQMIQIGAPAALQSAVFALSNICLQTAINSFGSVVMAGMAAAVNFEYFGSFFIGAFGQAATTFVGQNYGAGQYDRCRKILRLCMLEGVAATTILCAAFVLGRNSLIRIYTVNPEEIRYAMIRVLVVTPALVLGNGYELTGCALRGMGHSLAPALLTAAGCVVFRVIWIYVVFPAWRSVAVLLAVYPLSWILTDALVIGCYFILKKRLFAGNPAAA